MPEGGKLFGPPVPPSSRLALPGRIPSPSASSARFAANASISSWCSTDATCVACFACFARTSRTTTLRGLTRVSLTTARVGTRFSRSSPGLSSPSPRSAGFITTTSARPDRPRSPAARPIAVICPTVCHASMPPSSAPAGVGVRVGSSVNVLRTYPKRFACADHLFDRDRSQNTRWRSSSSVSCWIFPGSPYGSRDRPRKASRLHGPAPAAAK
jgi:hypothetical protein